MITLIWHLVLKAAGRNLKIMKLIGERARAPPHLAVFALTTSLCSPQPISSYFDPAAHPKGSKSSQPEPLERLLQPFVPSSRTEIDSWIITNNSISMSNSTESVLGLKLVLKLKRLQRPNSCCIQAKSPEGFEKLHNSTGISWVWSGGTDAEVKASPSSRDYEKGGKAPATDRSKWRRDIAAIPTYLMSKAASCWDNFSPT